MPIENNSSFEFHQHNYAPGKLKEEKTSAPGGLKKYKWLIALAVSLIIACIYNVDKLFATKSTPCTWLQERLHQKQAELKTIELRLALQPGEDYLKLSSDSLAHAIDIASISSQINNNKCTE